MSKRGKDTSMMKKGHYSVMMKRDRRFVDRQMEIRVSQAKEDWYECKQELDYHRRKLMASSTASENRVKREMVKIRREMNTLHENLMSQNRSKVTKMKSEYLRKNQHQISNVRQEMKDLREQ